jgi:hypothetical protein
MSQQIEIGRAWTIFLSAKEEELLIKILETRKLEPNKNGLKALVLNKIEKHQETTITPEMQFLINQGVNIAGNFIKKKVGL